MLPQPMRRLACALGLALLGAASAHAAFPDNQPVRLIVGFTPGGGVDTQARTLAQGMSERLGVPVIVENRPGASTMMAVSAVQRAEADGHTLLYTPSSSMTQNPHTLLQVTYDPFKDFTPIALAARGPLALIVHESVPATNVQELVDYLKANNGKASYASFGTGTSSHIIGELFARTHGLDVTHVAYRGGSDAARDLLAGRVEYMLDAAPNAMTSAATGKARILAITAPQRSRYLPEVPTFGEAGMPNLDLPSWVGLYGPAGMPQDVVERLNSVINDTLKAENVQRVFATGAYEVDTLTPAQFGELTRESYDTWGKVVESAGIEKQ